MNTKALVDVIAERERQITAEGYTHAHDDAHGCGELGRAAACYAMHACDDEARSALVSGCVPDGWPWAPRYWKPVDPRRDLVRAAALILAEIERLDREHAVLAAAHQGEK